MPKSDPLKESIREAILDAAELATLMWASKSKCEVKTIGRDPGHLQIKVVVSNIEPARYFVIDVKEKY